MEDKNELSDIVLDKEDNKSQKAKRILLIAALLIVIFLITIVIVRATNEPKVKNDTPKLNLPPEPIAKTQDKKPEPKDELFQKVDIQEADDMEESFEQMVKSLKEKEKEKLKKEIEKVPPKVEKKIEEKVKNIEIKEKIQKPQYKEKQNEQKNKVIQTANATKGYYVQVGATSRLSPDKKFLAKIEKSGYKIALLPIDIKGKKVTKILIGPYNTSKAARNSLKEIKQKINKDAFVYRVK